MKLAVEIDGESCTLELELKDDAASYVLRGAVDALGTASIAELIPGVYSVLLGTRSFEVRVASSGADLEIWAGSQRHALSISDARDRPSRNRKPGASGPIELRAQMPGKIVRLLVSPGAAVKAGQGLVVVEAMKMQNEMKSPKDGIVSKIRAVEGATVAAGETLVVVQ